MAPYWLGPVARKITIAEGIETALSVMQPTGLPTWAALSTSGMKALKLPRKVREVVIAADGDEPGRKAARALAARFVREGRRVRIMQAPDGKDWNDILCGKGRIVTPRKRSKTRLKKRSVTGLTPRRERL